jgi:hypothetical protein
VTAFVVAVSTISTARFFVAVLSVKNIWMKIVRNISIIGTCAVRYGVGLTARIFFGIDVVH